MSHWNLLGGVKSQLTSIMLISCNLCVHGQVGSFIILFYEQTARQWSDWSLRGLFYNNLCFHCTSKKLLILYNIFWWPGMVCAQLWYVRYVYLINMTILHQDWMTISKIFDKSCIKHLHFEVPFQLNRATVQNPTTGKLEFATYRVSKRCSNILYSLL